MAPTCSMQPQPRSAPGSKVDAEGMSTCGPRETSKSGGVLYDATENDTNSNYPQLLNLGRSITSSAGVNNELWEWSGEARPRRLDRPFWSSEFSPFNVRWSGRGQHPSGDTVPAYGICCDANSAGARIGPNHGWHRSVRAPHQGGSTRAVQTN